MHEAEKPICTYSFMNIVLLFAKILLITGTTGFIGTAAALKQVPSCEFRPMEAVCINVLDASTCTHHGEKALLWREEMACAQDLGDYIYVSSDGRDLNYTKFVEQGDQRATHSAHGEDYNLHNTARLDVTTRKALLVKLVFRQRITQGERAVVEE